MSGDKGINISEADLMMERIFRAGSPLLSDIKDLHELLKSGPLTRVLCQILKESDSKLTMVGTGDLSDEKTIKALIKIQGEAIGLSRAVEYIINFALATLEKDD